MALAHPSLAGAANGSTGSGSTAWKGTFRSQLYLTTPKADEGDPPEPDIRALRRAKANYARRDETIELRWKDGVFIPLHAPTGILGSIERRTCESVFLDLLDKVTAEGRHVSENSHASNYAPKIFGSRSDRERFGKVDFRTAMERLFEQHEIELGIYTAPNRTKYQCIRRSAGARGYP